MNSIKSLVKSFINHFKSPAQLRKESILEEIKVVNATIECQQRAISFMMGMIDDNDPKKEMYSQMYIDMVKTTLK